ncbi:ABC transporter permease [Thalassotalea atypica]|uniref:ABC transporter permease n=1 Tax=Thalassotalea atypica TaxID=2054316 RepID=UPI0025732983|nr:ABC transporter permease [Thalassotalea atypica]
MNRSQSQISEFILVLKTCFAEYLAKPLLNLGFITSLALATSTLLCILVLNDTSKKQYQQAHTQLKPPIAFHIVAEQGSTIAMEDFVHLRQLGFPQLMPIHLFSQRMSDGHILRFRAIDTLALAITMPDKINSSMININHAYGASLKLNMETFISFEQQGSLPVHWFEHHNMDRVALIDLSMAWQWFPEIKGLSHIGVTSITPSEKKRLAQHLPSYLSIRNVWSVEENQGFANALHLNLSALAVLGFIVSLFIAYQAANQAWQTRAKLAVTLRLLGVSITTIRHVMYFEALLISLIACFLGSVIASALVSILLPVLGLTLEQLYQLKVTEQFQWHWYYTLWALALSVLATLLALTQQFRAVSSAHIALNSRMVSTSFSYKKSFLSGVALLILFALWPQHNWSHIMLKYGLLLLASVAMLPNFLALLLNGLSRMVRSFRVRFIFKDAKQQTGRRFLPLAAFYLALTSSISAALMVNSFETSFVAYLNQLLNSDFFVRYQIEQKSHVKTWLDDHANVKEVVSFKKTIAKYKNATLDVYAVNSIHQQQGLLLKSAKVEAESTSIPLCYINEQLALKYNIAPGKTINITQGVNSLSCQVIAIYYDYGNQRIAAKIIQQGQQQLSGWQDSGFGVVLIPEAHLDKATIISELSLSADQVYEPAQIKELALKVFEQTFVLTQAIAFVLLSIACFGLFLSAHSLELARKGELHLLSSLGLSSQSLFVHMLLQWGILALLTTLLSWPIAYLLAEALVTKVLPASFGWSMPLSLNIAPFIHSSALGLLILIPALALPLYKIKSRNNLS